MTEVVDEYEEEFGTMPSPIPQFEYNDKFTDLENRIFQWDFMSDEISSFEGTFTDDKGKGKEKGKEGEKKKEKGLDEGKGKEVDEVKRMEARTNLLNAQNRAKELLLEEYKLGLIDKDTYLRKVSEL